MAGSGATISPSRIRSRDGSPVAISGNDEDGKIATFTGSSGEPILIGVSGNSGVFAAIRSELDITQTPGPKAEQRDVDNWANLTARHITALLADANPPLLVPADSEGPSYIAGTMLLAWREHLWKIETNAAIRPRPAVTAIGAGTDIALGSLYTSDFINYPAAAVDKAVRLACTYGSGCRIDDRGPLIHTT